MGDMYLWLGKGYYLFCDIVVFFRQWVFRPGHREVGVRCVCVNSASPTCVCGVLGDLVCNKEVFMISTLPAL